MTFDVILAIKTFLLLFLVFIVLFFSFFISFHYSYTVCIANHCTSNSTWPILWHSRWDNTKCKSGCVGFEDVYVYLQWENEWVAWHHSVADSIIRVNVNRFGMLSADDWCRNYRVYSFWLTSLKQRHFNRTCFKRRNLLQKLEYFWQSF